MADVIARTDGRTPKLSPATEQLVLATIRDHAEPLLRVARRHSLCADDAHDAYQRALEIFLRNAERLDPERASRWLYTVCKHEAMAVREQRRRIVGGEEVQLDAFESRTTPSPEERAISAERVARSAEALRGLKPQEVRALWLRAEGHSYKAICEETGWTYTKVNRCLAEGRATFLARYAGIESGAECRRLAPALSAMVDGEASAEQLVELRAHLRNCGACRAAVRELHEAGRPLAMVLPGLGLAGMTGAGHASLLHRLQGVLHGLGGKAAAVAVSAAAVAGGAVVVAAELPQHHHRHVRAAHAARPAAALPAAAPSPAAAAPAPVAARLHHPRRHHARPRRAAAAAAPAPVPAAPAGAPAPAPAPAAAPAPGEFGFEGR